VWREYKDEKKMFRLHASAPELSRRVLKVACVVGLALLLAGGIFFSGTRQAHASGGGGTVQPADIIFVHTATSANTVGDYTLLNESQIQIGVTGGPPLVTANWNPGGVYTGIDNHLFAVVAEWNAGGGVEWAIINEDQAAMPIGASFNVYIPGSQSGTVEHVQYVMTDNTNGYITTIDDPLLNNNPTANLVVTQYLGDYPVSDNNAIGTWYDPFSHQWTIYNEDGLAIPINSQFTYMIAPASRSLTQVATTSNTKGDSTCINNALLNGYPTAKLYITHMYSGYFTDVAAVWYNLYLGQWCIFNGSLNSMPIGAQFAVQFSSPAIILVPLAVQP
jgi:hypothetical protein